MYWLGFNPNAVDAHHIPTITHIAFLIGAVLSITTILWSALRVRELPLTDDEKAAIAAAPSSLWATLCEIGGAIRDMPHAMRQMGWMSLFQWYGFSIYWSYGVLSIGRSIYHTTDKTGTAFREAVLTTQQLGALYNLIGFAAAFAMVPITRRLGAKQMHMFCLAAAGAAMLSLPLIGSASGTAPALFAGMAMPDLGRHLLLLLPAFGLGLGWASIMGNPYVILAGSIPKERTGVYMGIFNMMIVIPMLLNAFTFPFYYDASEVHVFGWNTHLHGFNLLGGDSRHAISLAGVLLLCAAVTMIWVKNPIRDVMPHPEEPHAV